MLDNLKDGEKINKEMLIVKGVVFDDNLKEVKVNGKKVMVIDGLYLVCIFLENGSNEIKVIVIDLVGNKIMKKVVIDVNFNYFVIFGLILGEDKILKVGDFVKIVFLSVEDLDVMFVICLFLINVRVSV